MIFEQLLTSMCLKVQLPYDSIIDELINDREDDFSDYDENLLFRLQYLTLETSYQPITHKLNLFLF